MADSTGYDSYAPPEQSTGKKVTRNVVLPILSVLETILTAKASKGNFVGHTGVDMLTRMDEKDKSDEETRLKAVDRMLSGRRADAQEARAVSAEKRGADQLKLAQGKNEYDEWQKDRTANLSLAKEDRIRDAVNRLLGSPEGQKLTPSQREFAQVKPEEALKFLAFPDLAKDPVRAAAGPKALPAGAVEKLTEAQGTADALAQLRGSFKPEFAGYKMGMLGDIANATKRTFGDSSGQAQWWQDYQNQKNLVRHSLFGSSLTATERGEFDKAQINPGMDPGQIAQNLERQENAARRAAEKLAQGYQGAGYKTPSLNPAAAPAAPAKAAQASPGGSPAVGAVKTNNIGMKVRWSGSRWEPAQ